MKVAQAIAAADALCPNPYDADSKVDWLHDLDGLIYAQIISTHEDAGAAPGAYDHNADLIVADPYCTIYADYLTAMIHMYNGEYEAYTNAMMRYNATYTAFSNMYNRTHTPKRAIVKTGG